MTSPVAGERFSNVVPPTACLSSPAMTLATSVVPAVTVTP
jgi:hypothetical protein